MTKGQPERLVMATEPSPSTGTFNAWLQARLKASRLTQRELARKSGVDHSTISRLLRRDRTPMLGTVALLAHALGVPDDPPRSDTFGIRSGSRPARVEYALRSDELLGEPEVHEIMDVYLAARLRHLRRHAGEPSASKPKAPVPIVIEVAAPRSRTGPKSPSASARGRSS
jgi:transcriptional regulator with XRE-family HTH domain